MGFSPLYCLQHNELTMKTKVFLIILTLFAITYANTTHAEVCTLKTNLLGDKYIFYDNEIIYVEWTQEFAGASSPYIRLCRIGSANCASTHVRYINYISQTRHSSSTQEEASICGNNVYKYYFRIPVDHILTSIGTTTFEVGSIDLYTGSSTQPNYRVYLSGGCGSGTSTEYGIRLQANPTEGLAQNLATSIGMGILTAILVSFFIVLIGRRKLY